MRENLSVEEAARAMSIMGGDGKANAKITRDILSGADKGPKGNIVLLNPGAALYSGEIASSIEEGIEPAAEAIDTGKAMETLNKLVEYSNK